MKKEYTVSGLLLAVLLVIAWLVFHKPQTPDTQPASFNAQEEKEKQSLKNKRKIKYWQAPMDPTYIRDQPGKSPMGMDLVPVYEDESLAGQNVIQIDPVTVQNLGIRTAKVIRGPLQSTIRTVGRVTYDEEKVSHIHTKISGWVENLFVNTTGKRVTKGQKLLSIYSPELVSTQEEYLQALQYQKDTMDSQFQDVKRSGKSLVEAAKRRLLFMDIEPDQIRALEQRGEIRKTMTLHSPVTGIVIDKKVLAGMKVTPGNELYTIANIDTVWVIASVYEYELPFIRKGQDAKITLSYEPGVTYSGKISFIYPFLSPETRTVQVRMVFANPGWELKPEMYTDVQIKPIAIKNALLIPSEAVIRTGTRNVVITAEGEGKFLPKEVALGPEGERFIQIKSGLSEGETVVTSGQFLIDSESNLREAINKMLESGETAQPQPSYRTEETDSEKEELPKAGAKLTSTMSVEQKHLMGNLIDVYTKMHGALVLESLTGIHSEARALDDLNKKLKSSDQGGILKKITGSVDQSLGGLETGNLHEARDSFTILSRTLVRYVKGDGREHALASGIKIFFCPMKKERWLQKEQEVRNPYFGKKMLSCGTEENY